jgi:hypothetical protein
MSTNPTLHVASCTGVARLVPLSRMCHGHVLHVGPRHSKRVRPNDHAPAKALNCLPHSDRPLSSSESSHRSLSGRSSGSCIMSTAYHGQRDLARCHAQDSKNPRVSTSPGDSLVRMVRSQAAALTQLLRSGPRSEQTVILSQQQKPPRLVIQGDLGSRRSARHRADDS